MIINGARHVLQQPIFARLLLVIEGIILLLLTCAMWYDNTIRPEYFWLFWLAIPIFMLRWHSTGRLWTHTPLHDILILFVLLTALNYGNALYQKESYLAATARPLSGIWTFVYLIEVTRTTKSIKVPVMLFTGMSLSLGLIAITTSQWLEEKTGFLWSLIDPLPRIDYRLVAEQVNQAICHPYVRSFNETGCLQTGDIIRRGLFSFNVNEIAGALVWVAPVLAGIAMSSLAAKAKDQDSPVDYLWTGIRVVAGFGFIVCSIALLFGQSRFALAGWFASMAVLCWLLVPGQRWKWVAFGGLGLLLIIQLAVFLNVPSPAITDPASDTVAGVETVVSERDQQSVNTRLQIWQRGLQMMSDRPLTGVGMYMFRTAVANEPYIIPYFQQQNNPPPHSHNEWFHIAAEMGVPGLILFGTLQVTMLWMLWRSWHSEDPTIRTVTVATFAGLLAHNIYGLGDTIALWDRFQFVWWWVLGLGGAVYVLTRISLENEIHDVMVDKI